ncbi:cellulase family glycosylhydrolase [Pontibacter sp. G13]|uniref:cellulase family glycosylhydrolase n=1 Tax=Pontibacter sp. G13 TaxID=3074898 RepID=UPI00288C3481|nr:cellulase family glycosylhydrolase [Pontibacter sp. G13]WNJ18791.1 cellulase family glycosylhydrolase [Pontibacter sp. G13]
MRIFTWLLLTVISGALMAQTVANDSVPVPGQWSKERIQAWYDQQPWLVGCNYYPATAINQIDMWQAETWDPDRIDLELGWAADMGMNTLRVFLHDLVWENDRKGLLERMDQFLNICQRHGIRPWFVFFDDCHFPNPQLGEQPLPVVGYHNSGWVNCPARDVANRYAQEEATRKERKRLKGYVQTTMRRFKDDDRVLMWELYNEPGQAGIKDASQRLVYDSWVWARAVNPSQPITSCTAGSVGETNIQINALNSDLHSVHAYGDADHLRKRVKPYIESGRPVMVTEWLARDRKSTVAEILPVLKELNMGAVNWGFVSGESGTVWNWGTRRAPAGGKRNVEEERAAGNVVNPGEDFPEPEIWFHDLLRMDGTPYDAEEIALFRKLTGAER